MVDFKADERLNTLNHSCAHVMAQAVKHLYPQAKFWVGPVVKSEIKYLESKTAEKSIKNKMKEKISVII